MKSKTIVWETLDRAMSKTPYVVSQKRTVTIEKSVEVAYFANYEDAKAFAKKLEEEEQ